LLGEFVVNMMSEWYVESANLSSTPFPRGVNELEEAGMSTVPSDLVKPPRVGDAAIQLECKVSIE
jgi:flavin reductase (DIM6/NTAB) family NADH-FMN oxidoreductase RutF